MYQLKMPTSSLRTALAALALTTLGTSVQSQTWQRVIQLNNARGSAIGGGAGDTLYAGLGSGQVYRSTDNGVTWTLVTNGLVDSFGGMLVPKAFLVTPTGRVIRGGDNGSWNNKVGSPIFYSDNQGGQWTEVPLPFASITRNPAGIGVSDLVLHQGAIYFSDLLSEGVWKSTDNGATWVSAGEPLPTAPFVNFAKTYYALASAGDALLTVQASKGVFRSTDGGATWSQAVQGIPGVVDSPLVGGRTWNASDVVGLPDGTAFAVSDSRAYRSRDGGATWVEIGGGILQSPHPFAPTVILPSARKIEVLGDRVFVSSSDSNPRFFEATALGESWSELPRIEGNTDNGSILAQSFYAHNEALYFAGSQGIYRLDLATAVRTTIAPVVTTTPGGPFYANIGGTVTATAVARGTGPFTYEWRLNDVAIPGQTSATLNFSPADISQAGTLSVVVSNAADSVTVTLGPLIVAPAGPGQPDFSFRPQRPGAVTTFAIAPDGSVFYGGPFTSQTEGYTGVRRAFANGEVDAGFVTGALIGAGSGPGASVGQPATLLPLADGSVLVGASGTTDAQRYYRRLLPNGALDASWPWPAEIAGGLRKIVRLADGKFLAAGGSAGGIRRLNADGSHDPTFTGPATIGRFQANFISDFALLPGGHILIVGRFNEVDGAARASIARLLPNGALDRSWVPAQPPLNSDIHALALLPNGDMLIGGAFQTVGGQPRRALARLKSDGALDPAQGDWIPNTSPAGIVYALAAQPDGKVWVGGTFFGVQGRNYLFRLTAEGAVDTTFPDVGFNTANGGGVRALRFTADGRLWIGGATATVRGSELGNFFRIFTDAQGPTLGHAGLDQFPDLGASITLRGTVTGPFTSVQWRFQGSPIPGGTSLNLPLSNVSAAASGAYDLVVTSAGGSHTSAPVHVRVRGPVVIDLPPSSVVGIVSNSVNLAVSAFGQLPLAYQWLKDGVALANATNRTLSLTNLPLVAAGNYSVRVIGGDGSTATSSPATVTVIPAPGSTNASFKPGLFTTTSFTQFRDIEFLPNGQILVGGNFSTSASGGPNAGLARLNADGSVDGAFQFNGADLTEFVALERQLDGRLVILVRLNAGGGPYVVRRLREHGARDDTFAEATVTFGADLKLASDGGVLVIGQSGIERFNSNGTPDTGFNQRARLNNPAQSLAVDPAGRIYVTGNFTTVGGQPRAQLARLLADGTLDPSFNPTNQFSSQWFVQALPGGALVGDFNGFHRLGETGQEDPAYGWNARLSVWDVTSDGGLVGVLPTTAGDGVIRRADGTPALPASAMKVPPSFSGYSFLRVAPDGAFWLALGGNGAVNPATLLYKLNGTVTPRPAGGGEPGSFAVWKAGFHFAAGQEGEGVDADGDRLPNIAEFVMGSDPTRASSGERPHATTVLEGGQAYPAVTFLRSKTATGASLRVRVSSQADFADDLGSTPVSAVEAGGGRERVTLRSNVSAAMRPAQFLRVDVTVP